MLGICWRLEKKLNVFGFCGAFYPSAATACDDELWCRFDRKFWGCEAGSLSTRRFLRINFLFSDDIEYRQLASLRLLLRFSANHANNIYSNIYLPLCFRTDIEEGIGRAESTVFARGYRARGAQLQCEDEGWELLQQRTWCRSFLVWVHRGRRVLRFHVRDKHFLFEFVIIGVFFF